MKNFFFKTKLNIIFLFIPFLILLIGILGVGITGLLLLNHYDNIYQNEWKDKLLSRAETFYIQIQQTLSKEENLLPVSYIEDTEDIRPTVSIPSVVYDRNGNSIGYYGAERRDYISLDKMSRYFIYSLLASEDRRFFSHFGVDLKRSVGVALYIALFGDTSRGGGSSITQQLSRYLMDWTEVSIERKAVEILGAIDLERRYSKKQILEMYCNYVPFSHGAYGVENASQTFFGKSSRELDIAESALLVGVIPNPLKFSPFKSDLEKLQIAKDRHLRVLYSIVETGFIPEMDTKEEANKIYEEFWNKYDFDKIRTTSTFNIRFEPSVAYVGEQVRRELINMGDEFEKLLVEGGGLNIYTTIDLEYEKIAQKLIKEEINLYRQDIKINHYEDMRENLAEWKKLTENPGIDKEDLEDIEIEVTNEEVNEAIKDVQGALILIDNETGEILSFIGGESFTTTNQLIRTHQTKRQPGSSFKPLLYYSVLDTKKVNMYSKYEGPYKMVINYDKDKEWVVTNFSKNEDFVGDNRIPIVKALYLSVNTIAASLIRDLGIEPIRNNIKHILDIDEDEAISRFPDGRLSLALGTSEMSLLEMVTVYSTFARLGRGIKPYLISKVYDHKGSIIIDNENEARRYAERQILNEKTTYILTKMLNKVFTRGTASNLVKLSFPPINIDSERFDEILDSQDKLTQDEKDYILNCYELDENETNYILKEEYQNKYDTEEQWYKKVYTYLRKINYNDDLKGWYICKTGTTQGNIDSWLCGANEKYSLVVWVGNDNNYKLMRTGAAGAGPIWGRFMSEIEKLNNDYIAPSIEYDNLNIYHYDIENSFNIDLTSSYENYDLINIPVSLKTCKIPIIGITPDYFIDYNAVFYKGTEPGLYDKKSDYKDKNNDDNIFNPPNDDVSIDDLLSDAGNSNIDDYSDDVDDLVNTLTDDNDMSDNQVPETSSDDTDQNNNDEDEDDDDSEDGDDDSEDDDVDDFLQQLIGDDNDKEKTLGDLINNGNNSEEPVETED